MNKKILQWLALLFLVVVLPCLGIELYVRQFSLTKNFLYFQVDTKTFPYFSLVDNYQDHGTTIKNAKRQSLKRGARKYKAAFVGDSQTFGVGASDKKVFTEILQKKQQLYDVYNFGVPGYGLPEVQAVVDDLLAQEQYQIFVYTYNPNDIYVAMSGTLPLLSTHQTRFATLDEYEGVRGKLKLFIKDHIKSYFVINHFLGLGVKQLASLIPEKKEITRKPAMKADKEKKSENQCYEKFVNQGKAYPYSKTYAMEQILYADKALNHKLRSHLKGMNQKVKTSGGKLLVVLHYTHQYLANENKLFGEVVKGISEAEGIAYLDPYETYYSHRKDCSFYYDVNHLAEGGNQIMAEVLLPYLKN